MKHDVKKVIATHDISGMGRCSLSAVIPIMSAMGIQVCPLPTAVLSTQTDGYENFYFKDLTDGMTDYFDHLFSQSDSFDAFYSGFLGSACQIDKVLDMAKRVKGKTLVLVDPVMGDEGEFYSTFTSEMAVEMRKLVAVADIITPNITEASFLVDRRVSESPTDAEVEEIIKDLKTITTADIVVTGIRGKGSVNCAFSSSVGIGITENEALPKHYPGTGDIFASVLLGALLKGKTLSTAVAFASNFVKTVMEYSMQFDYPAREGVLFEKKLSLLMNF
ncbi:MAG: pyridoxamine kinase [Clostridia bacterium]|nr:pyridoxamine kinase [Clostridia bacterium]